MRFQAIKNGDADKDPVGQSNIGLYQAAKFFDALGNPILTSQQGRIPNRNIRGNP